MMDNETTIKDRLKKIVAWLLDKKDATSQKSLANMLGYNPSSFSQILNGRVPVSGKFLNRLVVMEPCINLEWVRTGKGEMLLEKTMDDDLLLVENGEELEFLTENTKGVRFYKKGDTLYMRVRHVPYAAFGQFANEADRLDPVEDEWSWEVYEVDHVARGNYLSFEVKGDSMDTGSRQSFEAGDRVLVREWERDRWRTSIGYKDHPYWVVVFGTSVLLKQIIDQDMRNCTFTFHSLNPSPEYADFTLSQNEIRALYRIIRKKPREMTF